MHVTTAGGERVTMRALGPPQQGYSFQVLWVATEDDWEEAERTGTDPDGIPWPTDAVSELAST